MQCSRIFAQADMPHLRDGEQEREFFQDFRTSRFCKVRSGLLAPLRLTCECLLIHRDDQKAYEVMTPPIAREGTRSRSTNLVDARQ